MIGHAHLLDELFSINAPDIGHVYCSNHAV